MEKKKLPKHFSWAKWNTNSKSSLFVKKKILNTPGIRSIVRSDFYNPSLISGWINRFFLLPSLSPSLSFCFHKYIFIGYQNSLCNKKWSTKNLINILNILTKLTIWTISFTKSTNLYLMVMQIYLCVCVFLREGIFTLSLKNIFIHWKKTPQILRMSPIFNCNSVISAMLQSLYIINIDII